jgi:hypothetical protein
LFTIDPSIAVAEPDSYQASNFLSGEIVNRNKYRTKELAQIVIGKILAVLSLFPVPHSILVVHYNSSKAANVRILFTSIMQINSHGQCDRSTYKIGALLVFVSADSFRDVIGPCI